MPVDTPGPSADPVGVDSDGDVEDRRLLAAHVAGDVEAFGALVARHHGRLWAVALRTLSDREEAADALQDALISAYRRAETYRGDARVTTWLHRVVVNACLDRARRSAVRPTSPLPDQGPGEPADPRDALAERETAVEVTAALAALPADQRAAIVLVDLTGLSVDEAAAVLEVPTGTVKSRCSRGRARLALSLGHLRNPDAAAPVPPSATPHDGSTEDPRPVPPRPAAHDAGEAGERA